MTKKSLTCPNCGSSLLWKDGIRYTKKGEVQRFICRSCGFRFSESRANSQVKFNIAGQILEKSNSGKNFSESDVVPVDFSFKPSIENPSLKLSEYVSSHRSSKVTIPEKHLNNFCNPKLNRQVCVSLAGAKNLAEVESREKRAAGATDANIKGKLVEFAWKLKKEGYSEATIREYSYILRNLLKRGADLNDPESVKEVIAKQEKWSNARKSIVVKAYTAFLKFQGLSWTPPKYRVPQKLPFIPLEKEIDDLIAGCNRQMAAFLQTLKETGARSGEAFNLKWIDIDFESNTIRVTPEKGSNPRIIKISSKLASMLANLPKKSMKVFTYKNKFYLRKSFDKQRKRVAHKLGNPRLLRITFHTFRHWKATMEYYKTKDILHVMQLLGHKNIKNTLIYTQLVKNISDDEYVCKVAKTLEKAKELIEAGFEYVCEMDGYKLFRKRK